MYVRRRNGRALAGVSSQPYGPRVYQQTVPLGMAVIGTPIGVLKKIAVPPKKRTVTMPVARSMSGVSSQPYGPRVYQQTVPLGIFGDTDTSILEPTIEDPITKNLDVSAKVDEVLRRQADEIKARKISQLVAIGGALFAAARLGIIWLPLIKKRISREP